MLEIKNLYHLYGDSLHQSLKLAKEGCTKDDIKEQTGDVLAVSDVSLEVEENEIFVVMGLSGCGKSTLLRCVNQLIRPTEGEVIFQGSDLTEADESELRDLRRHDISMVFQHFGLMPFRTAMGNVEYGLEVRGEDEKERKEKAKKYIKMVGLEGWEDQKVGGLSGGMQQRVGLARALSTEPDLLLMDEPFSALDPLIRRRMQREFISLMEEMPMTVLFVTHDLTEATRIGDKLAIMRDGKFYQKGVASEIMENPASGFIEEFVADVNPTEYLVAGDISSPPDPILNVEDKAEDAVKSMIDQNVSTALAFKEEEKLGGYVTLSDLEAASGGGKLGEFLRDVERVREDMDLIDLAKIMEEGEPLVAVQDAEDKVTGAIRYNSLLKAIH